MCRNFGILLCIFAMCLPFIAWFAGQQWMKRLAAADPVPNQGAMVIAFLFFCGSIAVALALLGLGGWLAVKPSANRDS